MKQNKIGQFLALGGVLLGLGLIVGHFGASRSLTSSSELSIHPFEQVERPGPLPAAEELGLVLPKEERSPVYPTDPPPSSTAVGTSHRYRVPTAEQREEAQRIRELKAQGIVVY